MNSKNHIKMQKSVIFVKKKPKKNMLKVKNIAKLEVIVIIPVNIDLLHVAYYYYSFVYR